MHVAPTPSLDAIFPARPGHIPHIRRAVTDCATASGADPAVLLHIGLAVSEAATNAIQHAYRDRGAADWNVHVMAHAADGYLDVSVSDNGIGMSRRPDSPGLGLGLGLMALEADRFEVRAVPGGGTEVLLGFRLSPS